LAAKKTTRHSRDDPRTPLALEALRRDPTQLSNVAKYTRQLPDFVAENCVVSRKSLFRHVKMTHLHKYIEKFHEAWHNYHEASLSRSPLHPNQCRRQDACLPLCPDLEKIS
jgi:Na+/phosphate symporter